MAKIMLDEPVSKFTNLDITAISADFKVNDAAKMMVENNIDSVLVFEGDELTGIITIKDILSDVVAKGKDPTKVTIKEIAHAPLIKIHKDAKVREAIDLMTKNDIRRLIVTNDVRPIGIISQKIVVGNMGRLAATLPELEIPNKVRCPYCSSLFDDKTTLSLHIDDIHIGKGLFEGNLAMTNELGTITNPDTYPKTL